ncbi:MAG: mate-domain-containing protein, partial [Piptocephalis tieghemiana]
WKEASVVVDRTVPISLACILTQSLPLISLISIGHLGKEALASAALGNLIIAVTGHAVVTGAGSAVDTLCSQAYGSDQKDHPLFGDALGSGGHLMRGAMAMTILTILLAFPWCFGVEWTLSHLTSHPPEIITMTGVFVRWTTPGLWPMAMFELARRYFQAQGYMAMGTWVLVLVLPFHLILNWALVWWSPLAIGFIGAPLATSLSQWACFLLSLVYGWRMCGYEPYIPDHSSSFSSSPLLSPWTIGTAGVMLICMEWWAFEVVTYLSGVLGVVALASQAILISLTTILFSIPQGLAASTSARVGNLLGAQKPWEARMAAWTALAIGAGTSLISCIALYLLRIPIAWAYSRDVEVIHALETLIPIIAIFQLGDGMNNVVTSVMQGAGKQALTGWLNGLCYYLLALPFGIALAFPLGLGLDGLWFGLLVGVSLLAMTLIGLVYRMDWVREAQLCLRVES